MGLSSRGSAAFETIFLLFARQGPRKLQATFTRVSFHLPEFISIMCRREIKWMRDSSAGRLR